MSKPPRSEAGAGSSSREHSDPSEITRRALSLAEESFLAATGPGGQNVNKVASAVQLQLNVFALRLPPDIFKRLKTLAGKRMSASGVITLTARTHRSQQANREAARARLVALITEAERPPPQRKKSRVNRVGKRARLQAKKARSEVKARRGKVEW